MQLLSIFALVLLSALGCISGSKPSFEIDYENDTFLKDGKPFRYISGSIHYFRSPHKSWRHILTSMKAAGLNAIETYIEWRSHEPEPMMYNFEGNNDFVKFIKTAQEVGLLVILRPAPYIDAERDMGGLPYWLLRENKNMKLRTSDPTYLYYMDRWFNVLLPMVKPLLYENGGPIITFQVENEYGSYYACDFKYTAHLRDLFREKLGPNVVLFSTDGGADYFFKCGKNNGVYSTVDFGPGTNVEQAFAVQRRHQARGPLVNSEYYAGWLDFWGYPHQNVSTSIVVKTLDEMLAMGANVNIYMFHGGTSFGFGSGSVGKIGYQTEFKSCPTSYDYDAPLSESGDPTPKYFAIRDLLLSKYSKDSGLPVPTVQPKISNVEIYLKPMLSLLDEFKYASRSVETVYPITFEEFGQAGGFLFYSTNITFTPDEVESLSIRGISDRGYVYVNKKFAGILSREEHDYSLSINVKKGDSLNILVENQGRICYGTGINDFKGIVGNVTLGGKVLTQWTTYAVNSDNSRSNINYNKTYLGVKIPRNPIPGVFSGYFHLPSDRPVPDTYLKLDGWTKGVAYINGYLLGRYWPTRGPQQTLFIPGSYLFGPRNFLTLLELEGSPCDKISGCKAQLVDKPIINGPVTS